MRKIGRDANGGRPRSGRMESSVDRSIGVYLLHVLYVSLKTLYLWKSFSAPVTNAERVWHICRGLCDCLRSRNLQGIPPPIRAIRFKAGMAGQEISVPDLLVFH
jgi:hypothetical protein